MVAESSHESIVVCLRRTCCFVSRQGFLKRCGAPCRDLVGAGGLAVVVQVRPGLALALRNRVEVGRQPTGPALRAQRGAILAIAALVDLVGIEGVAVHVVLALRALCHVVVGVVVDFLCLAGSQRLFKLRDVGIGRRHVYGAAVFLFGPLLELAEGTGFPAMADALQAQCLTVFVGVSVLRNFATLFALWGVAPPIFGTGLPRLQLRGALWAPAEVSLVGFVALIGVVLDVLQRLSAGHVGLFAAVVVTEAVVELRHIPLRLLPLRLLLLARLASHVRRLHLHVRGVAVAAQPSDEGLLALERPLAPVAAAEPVGNVVTAGNLAAAAFVDHHAVGAVVAGHVGVDLSGLHVEYFHRTFAAQPHGFVADIVPGSLPDHRVGFDQIHVLADAGVEAGGGLNEVGGAFDVADRVIAELGHRVGRIYRRLNVDVLVRQTGGPVRCREVAVGVHLVAGRGRPQPVALLASVAHLHGVARRGLVGDAMLAGVAASSQAVAGMHAVLVGVLDVVVKAARPGTAPAAFAAFHVHVTPCSSGGALALVVEVIQQLADATFVQTVAGTVERSRFGLVRLHTGLLRPLHVVAHRTGGGGVDAADLGAGVERGRRLLAGHGEVRSEVAVFDHVPDALAGLVQDALNPCTGRGHQAVGLLSWPHVQDSSAAVTQRGVGVGVVVRGCGEQVRGRAGVLHALFGLAGHGVGRGQKLVSIHAVVRRHGLLLVVHFHRVLRLVVVGQGGGVGLVHVTQSGDLRLVQPDREALTGNLVLSAATHSIRIGDATGAVSSMDGAADFKHGCYLLPFIGRGWRGLQV